METMTRSYRIVQNEGKITFRVEELWDGGTRRGPYNSAEAAMKDEEKIASNGGFKDSLSLQEIVEKKKPPTENFTKDTEGKWHCNLTCSIEVDKKMVVLDKGMTFSKGQNYLGVDVAGYLDEYSKK